MIEFMKNLKYMVNLYVRIQMNFLDCAVSLCDLPVLFQRLDQACNQNQVTHFFLDYSFFFVHFDFFRNALQTSYPLKRKFSASLLVRLFAVMGKNLPGCN